MLNRKFCYEGKRKQDLGRGTEIKGMGKGKKGVKDKDQHKVYREIHTPTSMGKYCFCKEKGGRKEGVEERDRRGGPE